MQILANLQIPTIVNNYVNFLKIVSILFLSIQIGCNSVNQKSHPSTVKDFDSKDWIMDSLGCKNLRLKLLEKLISNKSILLNKTKEEIFFFLGNPNVIDSGGINLKYFYYVSSGTQCDSIINPKYLSTVSTFYIYFNKKNEVEKVGEMIP